MVSYHDLETTIIVIVFGVFGVIIAMILNTLNTRGIVVDEFVTGSITINNLMVAVIILFLMIGVVVAAVKK